MRKISLVSLAAGLLALLLVWTSGLAVCVNPEVKVTPLVGFTKTHGSLPPGPLGKGVIDSCEEIRTVLGTPGKNIVASWSGDGDTVQVVYGRLNPGLYLWYALSFDGGTTWVLAPSSPGPEPALRLYPGIEQLTGDTLRVPYIAWQQDTNRLWWAYDQFFPFMLFVASYVDTPHCMFPSMELSDFADTILISVSDPARNGYLWRLLDGGPWEEFLMIDTQGQGKVDINSPLIRKGPGGYIFGYFEWAEDPVDSKFVPFYTESFDCGATWSTPDSIGLPYDSATGWWYSYDVLLDESDGYRPHIAVKFSPGAYEFSDVWELHPYAGSPGNWSDWRYTLLMGDANGGQRLATQPSIGRVRGTRQICITFSYFSDPVIGQLDIGMRCSTDGGLTWDPQVYQITNDDVAEEAVELAYEVSNYLHIVYLNDRDAPTYIMHLRYPNPCLYPGVEETEQASSPGTGMQEARLFQNRPNPFATGTTISYRLPDARCQVPDARRTTEACPERIQRGARQVTLSVFDLSGRLVRVLVDETVRTDDLPRTTTVSWDGEDDSGKKVPGGIYLYRLSTGSSSQTRKMVVVR